jgi:hypothetical protein
MATDPDIVTRLQCYPHELDTVLDAIAEVESLRSELAAEKARTATLEALVTRLVRHLAAVHDDLNGPGEPCSPVCQVDALLAEARTEVPR